MQGGHLPLSPCHLRRVLPSPSAAPPAGSVPETPGEEGGVRSPLPLCSLWRRGRGRWAGRLGPGPRLLGTRQLAVGRVRGEGGAGGGAAGPRPPASPGPRYTLLRLQASCPRSGSTNRGGLPALVSISVGGGIDTLQRAGAALGYAGLVDRTGVRQMCRRTSARECPGEGRLRCAAAWPVGSQAGQGRPGRGCLWV